MEPARTESSRRRRTPIGRQSSDVSVSRGASAAAAWRRSSAANRYASGVFLLAPGASSRAVSIFSGFSCLRLLGLFHLVGDDTVDLACAIRARWPITLAAWPPTSQAVGWRLQNSLMSDTAAVAACTASEAPICGSLSDSGVLSARQQHQHEPEPECQTQQEQHVATRSSVFRRRARWRTLSRNNSLGLKSQVFALRLNR